MRALVLGTAAFLLVTSAGADEPPLPKNLNRPVVALARAQADGKSVVVVVKTVQSKFETYTAKQVVYETRERVVGNKTLTEKVPVERIVAYQREVPAGYREVRLTGADVTARGTGGKAITDRKLVELLATEAPVLLSTSRDPVDPFHLLTTKAGTIVLHVDPAKLAPPADAAPPPR